VVWKAKDAEVTRRMKRIAAQDRKIGITLSVRGGLGTPLRAEARDELGRTAQVQSAMPLQAARDKPLHEGVLREKLCASARRSSSFGDSRSSWRARWRCHLRS